MKVPRVLHVLTSLDAGGMENGVCNLAQRLPKLGFHADVACLERAGKFAERLPPESRVLVLGKKSGFSPLTVWRLWSCVRRREPDILHTHNLGPLIYAVLATFGGRVRRIVHGEHSQLAEWELSARRLRQRRRFYRGCRIVHTVSEQQRDELASLGFGQTHLEVIPNGVDVERFIPGGKEEARARMGISSVGSIIGLVGRFGPYKGHARLLKAFRRIGEVHPGAGLVFIGSGGTEEPRVVEDVKVHPFRDRIWLLGYQGQPEKCYPALDLLVVPSTNEGMSNAVLEAMGCGVPVLANTGCGNESLINKGEDGWLADLGSEASLAAAVLGALQDADALVDTGRRARMTVARRFPLSRMLDGYAELYRRVLR